MTSEFCKVYQTSFPVAFLPACKACPASAYPRPALLGLISHPHLEADPLALLEVQIP